MNMIKTTSRLFAALLAALILVPSLPATAAKPQGISITPFEQQINLTSGDTVKSFTVTIVNHTSHLQEINLSARDFGSLNDTGGIVLEGSSPYTQKYGLASWLTLEKDTVDLNPGESADVLVTINNRSSLSPGGHYGAVVATVGNLEPAAGNRVAITQQLVSLVLVDKVGGEHYALKLDSLTHNGNWLHLPSSVTLRFQNPGNVHVVPRGTVELVSPGGMVVAKGIINDESAFVLPETFRELIVPLKSVHSAPPLPGVYQLRVDYRYDGISRTAKKSFALNFIDLGLYVLAGALVALGAWLVFRRWRKRAAKAL